MTNGKKVFRCQNLDNLSLYFNKNKRYQDLVFATILRKGMDHIEVNNDRFKEGSTEKLELPATSSPDGSDTADTDDHKFPSRSQTTSSTVSNSTDSSMMATAASTASDEPTQAADSKKETSTTVTKPVVEKTGGDSPKISGFTVGSTSLDKIVASPQKLPSPQVKPKGPGCGSSTTSSLSTTASSNKSPSTTLGASQKKTNISNGLKMSEDLILAYFFELLDTERADSGLTMAPGGVQNAVLRGINNSIILQFLVPF